MAGNQLYQSLSDVIPLVSEVLRITPLERAMHRFISGACHLINADYGVFIYCTAKRELVHLETFGLTWRPEGDVGRESKQLSKISLPALLVKKCKVISAGREIYENSASIEHHVDENGRDHLIFHRFFFEKFKTYIALPLSYSGTVVGELTFGFGQDSTLPATKRQLVRLLAEFASIVLKTTDQFGALRSGLDLLQALAVIRPQPDGVDEQTLSFLVSKVVAFCSAKAGHLRRLSFPREVGSAVYARILGGYGHYYDWAKVRKRMLVIPRDNPILPRLRSHEVIVLSQDNISMELGLKSETLTDEAYWSGVSSTTVIPFVPLTDHGTVFYLEIHFNNPDPIDNARLQVLRPILRLLGHLLTLGETEKAKEDLRSQQRERLEALRRISRTIVQRGQFDNYKATILEQISAHLKSELLTILFYDKSKALLVRAASFPDYNEFREQAETYANSGNQMGITGRVLSCQEGAPIRINDPRQVAREAIPHNLEIYDFLPSYTHEMRDQGLSPISHVLVVPIIGESGKVFGALRVMNKKALTYSLVMPTLDSAGFSSEDEDLLKTVATLIAQALSAERRANKLEALHRVGTAIALAKDEIEVGRTISSTIIGDLGYSACTVRLLNDGQLSTIATKGFRSKQVACEFFTVGTGLVGKAASTRKAIVAEDILSPDLKANGGFVSKEWAKKENLRSACCIPIIGSESDCLGVITVYMKTSLYIFFSYEVQLLETIAAACSVALRRIIGSKLLQESRERLQSMIDSLELVQIAHSKNEILDTCVPGLLDALGGSACIFLDIPSHLEDADSRVGPFAYNIPINLSVPPDLIPAVREKGQEWFSFSDFHQARQWTKKGFEGGVAMLLDFDGEELGIFVCLFASGRLPRSNRESWNRLVLIMRRHLAIAFKRLDLADERENLERAVPAIASAELVSGMVHEIKGKAHTAINRCISIRGYDEFPRLNRNFHADFTEIEDCVTTIGNLAHEYLNVENNLATGIGVLREQYNLNQLAEDSLFSLADEIRAMNVSIKRKLDKTLNKRRLLLDPRFMKLAIENLLRNALKWVGPGGLITIETGNRSEFSYLRVSDNGPGVPAENKEKIFQAFFSTSDTGFGLGLAISKFIVERMHQGKLLLTSLAEDTTFEIQLFG